MTDQDLIRRCVERAEGWEWSEREGDRCFSRHFGMPGTLEYDHDFVAFHLDFEDCKDEVQFGLDALAAELVRQVLATDYVSYCEGYSPITGDKVVITDWREPVKQMTTTGPDRTMNTLRAIDQFYEGRDDG